MRFRLVPADRPGTVLVVLLALGVLLVPGSLAASPVATAGAPGPASVALARAPADFASAATVAEWRTAPRAAVPDASSDAPLPGAVPVPMAVPGPLRVLVTLRYSNESRLSTLLASLSSPGGRPRPAYLTASEFDREFGPSPSLYRAAVAYFASYGVADLIAYADRTTISFSATPAVAGAVFGVTIGAFESGGRPYLAPEGPISLPAPLAPAIAQVEGLGTAPGSTGLALTEGTVAPGGVASAAASPVPSVAGYLTPAQRGSAQIEYAPDLQVAYDEPSLFARFGDPTGATIALLTGAGNYTGAPASTACGTLTTGEDVGGWDPADLSSYFAHTLPSGEPSPTVDAVPLDHAPAPSCLASWNETGTTAANTVDLEMIGSMAPGATIYGLYAPNFTRVELDTELATVLSPPPSLSAKVQAGLGNVSVVATAWGFADVNDSAWNASIAQAAVRGISVLAATGDSGDDPGSSHWVGSDVEFPASMAYAGYGALAVGGTTVTLDPSTLELSDQVVWNVSAKDAAQGGPEGTAGGPSEVFRQPAWQRMTSAGTLLGSLGRGVPDVAAMANDTAATVTVDGEQYLATNASVAGRSFYNASGTGVAVSLVAGEIAEIDHALKADGDPVLGFPDPTVYALANEEYSPLPNTRVHGSAPTGSYDSPLPMLPFRDVVAGRNDVWRAGVGYDLTTGWGSLDAYNFSAFLLSATSLPTLGPLSAIQDYVNVSGLGVGSGELGASVQQNLFLANSLGAPIVWVQSVLYLSEKPSGSWSVNFTAWVVFPFFGLYPNESVYTFWFPSTGKVESLPTAWDLTTSIQPASPSWDTTVTFSFGNGVTPLVLPAPGAAYLMGGARATYSWQGTTYTNGPRGPVADVPGFLTPQVGLYGYPGGATAQFTSTTAGSIQAYVKPLGASAFEAAATGLVTLANTQTGEVAQNLSYTQETPNDWAFAYSPGADQQGITVAVPYRYSAEFSEAGAPSGTTWAVQIADGPHASVSAATPALSFLLGNGTYHWTATISFGNYTAEPANGTLTIAGDAVTLPLVYALRVDSVKFEASGAMAFPFAWSVLITGGPTVSGTTPDLETNLTYAVYDYRISWTNHSWTPSRATGSFTVGATPAVVEVDFSLVTYTVKVSPAFGIGKPVPLTVTVGGVTKSGHATHTLDFPLPNGTYSFSVTGLPAGYHASPASGTIVVHGSPAPSLVIRITGPGTLGGLLGLGIYGYALVGGIAAAVVALVLVVRRRRRRRRAALAAEAAAKRNSPPPRGRSPLRVPPAAPPPARSGAPPEPRKGRYVDPNEL